MSYYPAVIVSVDAETATALIEATGKRIVLANTASNAVPSEFRRVGAKGFISFPKAPPVFTAEGSVNGASSSQSGLNGRDDGRN
jgi:hypothetical protein